MKSLFSLALIGTLVSASALANYQLSKNNKKVECNVDNETVTLNAQRTTLQYTAEGESLGPKKIEKVKENRKAGTITYSSSELDLTLSNKGDNFQYDGGDVEEVTCK